jgi:DNA-binding transcriptional LysR family regulator
LKIFIAIANTRGLKKAANRLGIHHTSCARRIKKLETQIGVSLFDRLPGGYQLTEAGEQLHQSTQLIQQEFYAIETNILGRDLRLEGELCLTLPNGFGTHLLMPDLKEFMELNPEIKLEINMTYHMRDLASREADVAIRHVENPPDSLAGKRVARIHRSAYASAEYLRINDPIKSPKDCHWLGWGDESRHLQWAEKAKFPEIPVRGNFYSDVLQLAAVQEHAGIASLPCFIADQVPSLRRIPTAEVVAGEWIWILAHKDMIRSAKVRAMIDYLYIAFTKHKDLIEGRSYHLLKE